MPSRWCDWARGGCFPVLGGTGKHSSLSVGGWGFKSPYGALRREGDGLG